MKRFMATLFATSILLIVQTSTATAFYSDVPDSYENYGEIKALYDLGKLPEQAVFKPNKKLTTADFYELILSFAKISPAENPSLPYSDTENSADYAPYIQTAIDLELIKPAAVNPKLAPSQTLPKHQALSKMFKFLGIGTDYFFDKDKFYFKDIDKNSELAPVAQKAAEIGIFEKDESYFKMSKRITKGEAAKYLYKIHSYNPKAQPAIASIIIESGAKTDKDLKTLIDIYGLLKTDYYYKDNLDTNELVYSAINGLLEGVEDIYTTFTKPEDAEAFFGALENEYQGIGTVVEDIDGNITVISPISDSPAEKAGLKPNDIIIKIDGESIIGQSLQTVVNKIKGPVNTNVTLTILRNGTELQFTIERKQITYEVVQAKILKTEGKNIAYIKVTSFGQTTHQDFTKAAKDLVKDSPAGFIIDLRNNPGGYLDAAVAMVGEFTKEKKPAVIIKLANGAGETLSTNGSGTLSGQKVIVLTNKGSASASEILAGALQDHGLATIIGTKSFGKGTVQNVLTYDDGSLFKYTIAKWFTPNDNSIENKGITPDIFVENNDDTITDHQLNMALEQF